MFLLYLKYRRRPKTQHGVYTLKRWLIHRSSQAVEICECRTGCIKLHSGHNSTCIANILFTFFSGTAGLLLPGKRWHTFHVTHQMRYRLALQNWVASLRPIVRHSTFATFSDMLNKDISMIPDSSWMPLTAGFLRKQELLVPGSAGFAQQKLRTASDHNIWK